MQQSVEYSDHSKKKEKLLRSQKRTMYSLVHWVFFVCSALSSVFAVVGWGILVKSTGRVRSMSEHVRKIDQIVRRSSFFFSVFRSNYHFVVVCGRRAVTCSLLCDVILNGGGYTVLYIQNMHCICILLIRAELVYLYYAEVHLCYKE